MLQNFPRARLPSIPFTVRAMLTGKEHQYRTPASIRWDRVFTTIPPMTRFLSGAMECSKRIFLNPIGIVNSANFAPITNSIAPGEFLTLFGTNLSPVTLQAQSLPLQTNL